MIYNKKGKKMNKKILFLFVLLFVVSCSNKNQTTEIDTTAMTETIAISQLTQIIQNPMEYAGKMVKMEGEFTEQNGHYYCVKQDVTQCCGIPMEFTFKSEIEEEKIKNKKGKITITGTVQIYTEKNKKYVRLNNAAVVQ